MEIITYQLILTLAKDRIVDSGIISGKRLLPQAQLMDRVARAASGFNTMGIGENGAVTIMLRNDFAFFEASMAATLIGAYGVPINWHYKDDETAYIIDDCGAVVLVIHADILPTIEHSIPEGIEVLVVPTPPKIQAAYGIDAKDCSVPAGHTDWNEWVVRQKPWAKEPTPARTNMIYTSGTTGRPKGVRRLPTDAEMTARMAASVATIFDLRPDQPAMSTVITGPAYHFRTEFLCSVRSPERRPGHIATALRGRGVTSLG